MKRQPAASGRFYPADKTALKRQIVKYMPTAGHEKVIAVVAPHAGYDFSGSTAGAAFSKIRVPGTVIILGPHHWGTGPEFAIVSKGTWEMPFGEVRIDADVATSLKEACEFLQEDAKAHANEHSLEVEIPFLQHANPHVQIVPIAISTLNEGDLENLGKGIAETIRQTGKDILIVASTDMSHTERSNPARQEEMRKLDMMAVQCILDLDARGLLRVVHDHRITMCGPGPVAVAVVAAKLLGAESGRLVSYTTSCDTTGDYSYVVGYASLLIA